MKAYHRPAQIILLLGALAAWPVPGFAQATGRLSDKDVKALIDLVDQGRDKFEGNLDGAFKGSTLRGPTGEAKVSAVLQDYQDNTQKLKDRFTADYSASAEVATVLKQSTAINTFMSDSPSSMKGRSEWDSQAGTLKRLAETYGSAFPLPDGAAVRRINDKEASGFAASVATAAESFKNTLGKTKTLAKPDQEAAKKDVELLIKQANAAKSRINDGKPATGEVRQLIEQVAKLQTFVSAHEVSEAATSWQSVQASLGKLQQAFGLIQ